MRVVLLLMFSCAFGVCPAAAGFILKDLRSLSVDASGFVGGQFAAKATDARRLTIYCTTCAQFTAIDVIIGRSTDGTEQRYRSGTTTIEKMAALCRSRSPSCKMRATASGSAVGWISEYDLGATRGSTVVLFLDGDLLTIRSISDTRQTASANAVHALKTIAPLIVGKP